MAARGRLTGERTVGFLDLGTHSVRLLVVRIAANHAYQVLTQQKEPIRLGEREFPEDVLHPEAMARAVAVCRHFVEMARSLGATTLQAVATAATREAGNQEEFLTLFQEGTGIPLHVVSALEEARLIYLGVSSGLHLQERRALFLDIGGGTTEIIVGDQYEHHYLDSLKLGALRLTTLFPEINNGPVSAGAYRALREHVRTLAVRTVQRLREHPFEQAFGSSGTIANLAQVAARALHRGEPTRPPMLTLQDLSETAKLLCSLPTAERRGVAGLNPERADIIIGGTAILHTLLEDTGVAKITVSDRGLRDGLLVDYLQRYVYSPEVAGMSVRARSVMQLGRHCCFDERHAAHVAMLAGMLFDSAAELALHTLGADERELLTWAGQLHDIGMFLSFVSHHEHSRYFVQNADLLGFDQREIAVIAATVLFHRKAPRAKHPVFAALDPAAREVVRVLSLFLRLAESLDRSHAGLVQEARFVPDGKKQYVLTLTAANGCPLELVSAGHHAAGFRETFGKPLVVGNGELEV